MDKIIGFSDDELLLKILSFLPTQDAVRTSVLSKQWRFLWMRVPKLDYDEFIIWNKLVRNRNMLSDSRTNALVAIRSSIDRNLRLLCSPVIESMRLRFLTDTVPQPEDIKSWVEIAVSRYVQELSVNYFPLTGKRDALLLLPSSLYTCKSLVTLKLLDSVLVDVPHVFCLPSLKTLHLVRVTYADEKSLQRILSNCSVLEDLVVNRHAGDNLRNFAVIIPSLFSLSVDFYGRRYSDEYVIDTPSLKYFKVHSSMIPSSLIVRMPKLEEADIATRLSPVNLDIKKLLEPVTSATRLSLCILNSSKKAVLPGDDDIVFNELKHLKLRVFYPYWSKLLFWLLKASPKLRDLEFHERQSRNNMGTLVFWKQLTSVPQCLLSCLQTFKWSGYHASVEAKDLTIYILRNSCQLMTATISIGQGLDSKTKLDMQKEVKISFRGSPTCYLVFN